MVRSRHMAYFGGATIVAAMAAASIYLTTSNISASSDSEDKGAPGSGAKPLQMDQDAARRAGLTIERLERKDYTETLSAFGTVGANRNRYARVSAPVAGRLVKIDVDLGAHVAQGGRLATLESPDLADARSAFNQNQTELNLARANLDRARKLTTDNSIAQKDYLRIQADFERAQAVLASSQARLATLNAATSAPPGEPPADLDVVAPIAGSVVARTAVLGEYAQAYQALFTIADLSTVWVEASLYERDLAAVRIGAKATVTVSAYPERRFEGTVTYVASILDKDTRTTMARIEVANPDGALKPGLFANATIDKTERRSVLSVPDAAVVLLQGQSTVFVAKGDGYMARPVEIADQSGGRATIKSGLEPGDQVVVSGAYALKARLLKSQLGDAD